MRTPAEWVLYLVALVAKAAVTFYAARTRSFGRALLFFPAVAVYMGVRGPVKRAYLNQLVSSEQRAAVVSFDSMMGSGGGVLSRAAGVPCSESLHCPRVGGGGLSMILVVPPGLLRRLGGTPDIIAGTARAKSGFSGQGLPLWRPSTPHGEAVMHDEAEVNNQTNGEFS